ncbi:MAG: DNA-3-methyladenine glycosylase 2 family protein [Arenimonas sp.]|nr:DNA-3-methyladenine glycosylase 2 family protein [Arenimonas sp.]
MAIIRQRRGFDLGLAAAHLAKRDRKLGRWIERIGPLDVAARWRKPFDTTDSLARAILYQQLSGKAAATIVGRVEVAIAAKKLHADTLGRIDDATLRACGVSGNKTLALRDLAARDASGEVPSARDMATMADADIIERLTAVRGIGRWTVEMMLMFSLGRPDVLPVDDLGVRKGAQLLDKLAELPAPKALLLRGEKWGPYRTLAALYLWRVADGAAPAKPAVKRSQD